MPQGYCQGTQPGSHRQSGQTTIHHHDQSKQQSMERDGQDQPSCFHLVGWVVDKPVQKLCLNLFSNSYRNLPQTLEFDFEFDLELGRGREFDVEFDLEFGFGGEFKTSLKTSLRRVFREEFDEFPNS